MKTTLTKSFHAEEGELGKVERKSTLKRSLKLKPIWEDSFNRQCLVVLGGIIALFLFFAAVDYYYYVVDGQETFLFHN